MVTLGLFKSGSTSTGRFTNVNTPYTISRAAIDTTSIRFFKEKENESVQHKIKSLIAIIRSKAEAL